VNKLWGKAVQLQLVKARAETSKEVENDPVNEYFKDFQPWVKTELEPALD
jgi:hypothetical protein